MKKSYLYHLTNKEFLDAVLKNGLIPKTGDNSELVSEQEPRIYLTSKKDIELWSFILRKYEVLKVDVTGMETENRNYGAYAEYLITTPISPKRIKYCGTHQFHMSANIEGLMISYLHDLNYIARMFLRAHEENDKDLMECAVDSANAFLTININYKDIFSQKELSSTFKDMGENGEYTIFDTRIGTEKKMYKHLLDVKNDVANQLNRYIVQQFKGCLKLNTGGWE